MTIEETKQKIMTDDDFVLSEAKRVQELYKMKQVIRYHHNREEVIDTESVAEHVYGMLILAEYFLTFEDPGQQWNYTDIVKMALYHDMDEILTGDIIGYMKTDNDRKREYHAQKEMIALIPPIMQSMVEDKIKDYENQETTESRFVKAVDKIEPLFHLFSDNGKKILHDNKTTYTQNASIKDRYVEEFLSIKRFNEVMSKHMESNGYFFPEAT